METTGKSERKPIDEEAARPDNMDAVPLDSTLESAEAEDAERCEAASCAADSDGGEDAASAEDVDGGKDAAGAEDVDGGKDAAGAEDIDGGKDAAGAEDIDGGKDAAGAEDIDAAKETDSTDGNPECDAPAASGGLAKLRGMAHLSIDSDRLRTAWRAHSLARIASTSVLVCALAVGSAYFLVMQPISTRLHRVREQKGLLHDYMVIQQADAAIGTFQDGLMTGDQRLTVMSEVRLMAEGSGVKIVGDPDLLLKRDVSGHFVEYPIRLRVKGSFHGMGEFLSLLEGSPRFVLVEEIEIMSDVAGKSSRSEATVLLALAAWEG